MPTWIPDDEEGRRLLAPGCLQSHRRRTEISSTGRDGARYPCLGADPSRRSRMEGRADRRKRSASARHSRMESDMHIKQPSAQLDHMLRQTRMNLVAFSQMADTKAHIILSLASVLLSHLPHPDCRPALHSIHRRTGSVSCSLPSFWRS